MNISNTKESRAKLLVLDANIIKKFKEGLHKLRSPDVNYNAIWDINNVLYSLKNILTETDINITRKPVCLFMLLSGTRVNTIVYLKSIQNVDLCLMTY